MTALLSTTNNEKPIDEDPLNVNEIPYGPQEILARNATNEDSGMSSDAVTFKTPQLRL